MINKRVPNGIKSSPKTINKKSHYENSDQKKNIEITQINNIIIYIFSV